MVQKSRGIFSLISDLTSATVTVCPKRSPVPAIVARRLLQTLSPEERNVTLQLLGYEEGTAGREMIPLFVDLHSDMTAHRL